MQGILTVDDVRRIASAGSVGQSPKYHAREHHVRFDEVVEALRRCVRVEAHVRVGPDGRRRHPSGYVAWGSLLGEGHLRVDFNLVREEDDDWILVVTAFEV